MIRFTIFVNYNDYLSDIVWIIYKYTHKIISTVPYLYWYMIFNFEKKYNKNVLEKLNKVL